MSHWRHGMLSLLRSERVFRSVGAGCVLAAIIMLALALAGCASGGSLFASSALALAGTPGGSEL